MAPTRWAMRAARRMRVAPSGPAGEGDHDPLPGLPDLVDAVLVLVLQQPLVHPVGDPQQRQLAQRRQVPDAEVVGQRGVDLLRLVDVAVGHAPAQRLRGLVDQFDLVGGAHDLVRDGLALRHAGDLGDGVVEGFQVLHVHRGDDVDPGGEQFLDVLPALGVAGAGDVGVRELVDDRDLGVPGQHRVDVHLGERGAAVGDGLAGDDLQPVEHRLGVRPVVGLHEPDHHVGAAFGAPLGLVQHVVGLADARCGAQVDPQFAPGTHRIITTMPILPRRRASAASQPFGGRAHFRFRRLHCACIRSAGNVGGIHWPRQLPLLPRST